VTPRRQSALKRRPGLALEHRQLIASSQSPKPDILLLFLAWPVYNQAMTKLLERALEAARTLPADAQDDIARVVLRLAGTDEEPPVALSSDERTAVATSQAAAARGDFATDEQVRAVWSKHGL
jgi:hypothetical protein